MKIDRVTITGADDSTNPLWMVDVTKAFPFVEWGILISSRRVGEPRYPSLGWCVRMVEVAEIHNLPLSVHICGRLVRNAIVGDWCEAIGLYGSLIDQAQRIQMNVKSSPHSPFSAFAWSVGKRGMKQQFIFQTDSENDRVVSSAHDDGLNVVPLYDRSGGKGLVPAEWPQQMAGIYSGYAGGLGPDNVLSECQRIANVVHPGEMIWIDMETKVRTEDGTKLCSAAVENVLSQMAQSQYLAG